MSPSRAFYARCVLCLFFAVASVSAQQGNQPELISSPAPVSVSSGPSFEPIQATEKPGFQWKDAARQSFTLLTFQHGFRLATESKTRRNLRGPFFKDWGKSIAGIQGWDDGDSFKRNYIGHPMQGAVTGYIQIQNDPFGRTLEFSKSRRYWSSRLRAMGWAAIYSAQWEIGPYSEATIGNVGMKGGAGRAGFVDFVVTPTGGFAMIVTEDWLDRKLIQRFENGSGRNKKRFYRSLLNPQRSLANLLRGKVPWHRDTRSLD